jgi:uncharacterized protein (TIGR02246 family)
MRRHPRTLAAALWGAVACSPATPSIDTAADTRAINAVRDREIAAFSAGAVDSHLVVLTGDAVLMPPNEPAVAGTDAIRTWAQNVATQFAVSGQYTDSQIRVMGDWAIERYTGLLTVTPKAGGPAVEERLKGIHVYQRQSDGSWRIAQDIWNTDAPPPSQPATK